MYQISNEKFGLFVTELRKEKAKEALPPSEMFLRSNQSYVETKMAISFLTRTVADVNPH